MGFSFWNGRGRPNIRLGNERGQSLIEYLLVLIVAVILILTFMWLFSTAFQSWANNYFGDYLTCLLEVGELPSIGGTPGDSGVCNQLFEPFSLSNGRSLQLAASANTGGGTPPPAAAVGGNATPVNGYRPNYGGGGGGPGGGGGTNAGGTNAGNSGGDGSGGAGNKKTDTGNLSLSGGEGYSSRNENSFGNGYFLDDNVHGGIKKDDEGHRGYFSNTHRGEDEGRTAHRMRLKPQRSIAAASLDDKPFTIGNFFRILIIAAIIIALVVVIGGQMLQITKSMDAE